MPHSDTDNRTSPLLYAKLVAMPTVWGGTFIAGRLALDNLSPFSTAFCRYAIATLLLLGLTRHVEGHFPRLQRSQVLPVVVLGLTGIFACNAFFYLGLDRIPASRASLIVTANPTVIALGGALFLNQTLTPLRLVGIVLGLLGAGTVITEGAPWAILQQGASLGDLYLVGNVLSWSVYSLVGKAVMSSLSPVTTLTYACVVGTPLLLPPALAEGLAREVLAAPPLTWLCVLYLALLGTMGAFYWYYQGVQAIGPDRASIFINAVPVVAVALSVLLLDEPLTRSLLVGGALVVSGVFLTNRF